MKKILLPLILAVLSATAFAQKESWQLDHEYYSSAAQTTTLISGGTFEGRGYPYICPPTTPLHCDFVPIASGGTIEINGNSSINFQGVTVNGEVVYLDSAYLTQTVTPIGPLAYKITVTSVGGPGWSGTGVIYYHLAKPAGFIKYDPYIDSFSFTITQ